MTKRMKWGFVLIILGLYSRTFSDPILDGWLACGSISLGIILWLVEK